MGARITKNVSAEYGEQVSGKRYKLLKDICICPNTGHKFRHDKYFTMLYECKNGILIPQGSIVNVHEVYIGTNIPDGGDFITITADIEEYEGIVVNELFSPQRPAIKSDIKFKPNAEYIEEIEGNNPVDKDTILLPNEDINTLREYVRSMIMLEKFSEQRPQSIEELKSIEIESVEELSEWDCHLFLQAAYVIKMCTLEIIDGECLDKTKFRIDSKP